MTTEDNKELYRRCWLECFNQGDLSVVDELLAPNYVWHGLGQEINSHEGVRQLVVMLRSGLPDIQLSIERQFAEGDEVATRWRIQGTHKGNLFGVAPSGKRVNITGLAISRFAQGKIAEEWEEYDQFGLLQQIGAIPSPEQAPA